MTLCVCRVCGPRGVRVKGEPHGSLGCFNGETRTENGESDGSNLHSGDVSRGRRSLGCHELHWRGPWRLRSLWLPGCCGPAAIRLIWASVGCADVETRTGTGERDGSNLHIRDVSPVSPLRCAVRRRARQTLPSHGSGSLCGRIRLPLRISHPPNPDRVRPICMTRRSRIGDSIFRSSPPPAECDPEHSFRRVPADRSHLPPSWEASVTDLHDSPRVSLRICRTHSGAGDRV